MVHIDEMFIGAKRKYGRGRDLGEPKWLFGIVDRANHKCFVQFIPDKSHPSIIPIIQHHCQQGIHIHSDGAQVYHCLNGLGFIHRYVVHEHHYVNPLNGVHSNHIENLWSNMKAILKQICGSQGVMLDSHLDEFMYRYSRKNEGSIFDLLIQDIANFNPV